MTELEQLQLLPGPTKNRLNTRQRDDYEAHRRDMFTWLLNLGKDPDLAEGYSVSTLTKDAYRIDKFYRWVWDQEGGYTTDVTTDHADEYLDILAYGDKSNSHNANCVKAIKRLFKWKHHCHGSDLWEPTRRFSRTDHNPKNYLTRRERNMICEAALEYGSIPAYNDLSPDERARWKAHLAQRFDKPKAAVKPADWKRANGYKIPSLVWVSMDAGLRPCEVKEAKVSWVDVENGVLRIPKEDSSKNQDNWIVGLRDRTTDKLERWIEEREQYEKYRGTDALWLTRFGNPYSPRSLKYVIQRLCDVAGIPYSTPDNEVDRSMSWYAIRHSTGTYLANDGDLDAAQSQLRHKSSHTTMKYAHAPVEERKKILDKMG